MKKEDLDHGFKAFLKANDAYIIFLKNIYNKNANGACSGDMLIDDYIEVTLPEHYVNYAFLCEKTPQRCAFWLNIHNKWIEYYYEKHLNEKKPPVGLRPKFIADMERLDEIGAATLRYLNAGVKIPPEWIEEYNELADKY